MGTDDVPVTIENVMQWDASADTAERFQQGRIFLAGDAAHVMPPSGGFGGNTGVQDAHNLAWKLAAVLKGIAGENLLSTYDAERRPAAAFTVEQAYSRYVTRSAPYLRSENMQAIENDLNIELGYCYHSAAVIPDPDEKSVLHDNPRETRGRPGTRAPHILLERSGEKISSLDLFGRNFVLLAGPEGRAWKESGRDAAKQLGLSLDVYMIGRRWTNRSKQNVCGCVWDRPRRRGDRSARWVCRMARQYYRRSLVRQSPRRACGAFVPESHLTLRRVRIEAIAAAQGMSN